MNLKNLKTWLVVASVVWATEALSSPAWPWPVSVEQPNGRVINVYLRGDENIHFFETTDGMMLKRDHEGRMCYACIDGSGHVVASTVTAYDRHATDAIGDLLTPDAQARLRKALVAERDSRIMAKTPLAPGAVKQIFPTTGKIRGLIILAEYADMKFSCQDINEVYDRLANEKDYNGPYATGSIRDYFTDQSAGLFEPEFDVVGPVTLPGKMSHYGLDENVVDLMVDACTVADRDFDVDFSRYDFNDDGTVDFVYVVYAGYSEAQGAAEDTMWPQSVDLTYKTWKMFDNMYLGQSSCSSELKGCTGNEIDGIGTFCHEFSHILGLPDIYDPMYSGYHGMMYWDVMDVGLYNNDSRTPSGYTAMDKYSLGWLEPTVVEGQMNNVELEPLSSSNKAVFIVNEEDENEYFVLENRQLEGWDSALPGHGLLVSHVHYVPSLWQSNRVNTAVAGYEHVALVPADNVTSMETLATDTYPGDNGLYTELSANSVPAMTWRQGGNACHVSVVNIRESQGVISFDFSDSPSGVSAVDAEREYLKVGKGFVDIDNAERQWVKVSAVTGAVCSTSNDIRQRLFLQRGFYLVSIGQRTFKLTMK